MISVNKGDLKVDGSGIEILTDITFVVGFMARKMCEESLSCDYKKVLQEIIECVYTQALNKPFPTTNKDTEGK